MLTRDEFAKFVFALSKVVPTYAPDFNDNSTLTLWYEAFAGYNIADLRKVYAVLRDTEKVFPSLVRIKEVLRGGDVRETFEDLVALISAHGAYKPPSHASYTMCMTINRLGGWQKVCDWSDGELPFRKKDFEETFEACSTIVKMAKPENLLPETLGGIHASAESHPVAQIERLIAGESQPIPTEQPPTEIDWDAVLAAHPGLDLNVPQNLLAKGFFKLAGKEGFYFRYCHGQKPGTGWPDSFVDAVFHSLDARKKVKSPEKVNPDAFDPQKYNVSNFND